MKFYLGPASTQGTTKVSIHTFTLHRFLASLKWMNTAEKNLTNAVIVTMSVLMEVFSGNISKHTLEKSQTSAIGVIMHHPM